MGWFIISGMTRERAPTVGDGVSSTRTDVSLTTAGRLRVTDHWAALHKLRDTTLPTGQPEPPKA